jgi:hypothetical protein
MACKKIVGTAENPPSVFVSSDKQMMNFQADSNWFSFMA